MNLFIPKDILDMLSYRSTLGRSLKQISLSETPIDMILDDIAKYRAGYIDTLVQENLIGSRFKSEDSIMRKYKKTIANHGGFMQCFNDVLGFRLRFDEYPESYPDYFRVVDLRNGKQVDDGYRAIHLYYQRDNLAYPIEVQLWCGKIITSTSGAINMSISTKVPRSVDNSIWNMLRVRSRPSGSSRSGCKNWR